VAAVAVEVNPTLATLDVSCNTELSTEGVGAPLAAALPSFAATQPHQLHQRPLLRQLPQRPVARMRHRPVAMARLAALRSESARRIPVPVLILYAKYVFVVQTNTHAHTQL